MDNLLDQVRAAIKASGKEPEEVEAAVKEVAAKCGMDYAMPVAAYEPPPPYGGATSFAEIDAYQESANLDMHVTMTTSQFETIVRNVLSRDDLDMAEKGTLISDAANDLQARVDNPPPMMKERRGVLDRLFGSKRDIPASERNAASASDFAGPNRSFPILKPEDVSAAVSSMGRSGSANPETLKRNIIRIARRKGPSFVAKLPKSWNVKEADDAGSFTVFKDAAGDYRWLAVYSNNFYDRDGEVFTEAAHKDYAEWVERTGRFPQLWLWHTPGSKVGKADVIDYQDGLAIASGVFDANQLDVARSLAADKGLGVSHGYTYDREDLGPHGDYRRYRTFEISPLPAHKAANEKTLFFSEKEDLDMELTKEKRDFLVGKLGEDRVKGIEGNLGQLSKELKESGLGWTDFTESVSDSAPAAAAAEGSSTTVRPEANAAAGSGNEPSREDAEKALTGMIANAVKAAIEPLETRLKDLEGANNAPRSAPGGGYRPTEQNAAVNGNAAAAKEAQQAAKEGEGSDEDPLAWYRKAFTFTAAAPQQQEPVGASGASS